MELEQQEWDKSEVFLSAYDRLMGDERTRRTYQRVIKPIPASLAFPFTSYAHLQAKITQTAFEKYTVNANWIDRLERLDTAGSMGLHG